MKLIQDEIFSVFKSAYIKILEIKMHLKRSFKHETLKDKCFSKELVNRFDENLVLYT